MSILVIIGDGMADEPIPQLHYKTPLQVAHTPHMDYLAAHGQNGWFKTVPEGWEVGSDVACLSILGYDLNQVYQGRSSFEAASLGVPILSGEMVFRCNFISVEQGIITSFTADHISTKEAASLIETLNTTFKTKHHRFFLGQGYRHLFKLKGKIRGLECISPHNAIKLSKDHILLKSKFDEDAILIDEINATLLESQKILTQHPINKQRIREGKKPANAISLWAPGYTPKMNYLRDQYPIKKGSVVSATDLIKGIGYYAGLQTIEVVGATGQADTNYENKTTATLQALQNDDFVLLHIEASDEASHDGDYQLKIKTIEDLDSRVIQPILKETSKWQNPPLIVLLPDHPTSSISRVHLDNAVPLTIFHPNCKADGVLHYEEWTTSQGSLSFTSGKDFMDYIFQLNQDLSK